MQKLKYYAPFKTFGRPLTPEILEAIGIVTGYRAPAPAVGRDGGPGEFDLWTTTSRMGVNYRQGLLELTREQTSTVSGNGRTLRIRELRLGAEPTEQREHCIEAVVTCGRDRLWRPRAWSYTSWIHDPSGRVAEETLLLELGRLERRMVRREFDGTTEEERLSGTDPAVFHWGLFEAVRRLPRRRGFVVAFDCLEHLRKIKRGHRLAFLRTRTAEIHRHRVRLHGFVQWGPGILPTEYWVDDADRLLLVIDGNRVAVSRALRPDGGNPFHQPSWRVPQAPAPAPGARRRRVRPKRPNLLFICTDQQHAHALSAAGNPHLHTPAMDALWRRGIRLTEAYCTNPICSPSRSSLFTGRMPSETGINRLNPHGIMRAGLPTLGEWLQARGGYDCVYSGKWHVPACHSYDIPGFRVLSTGQDHRGDISDVTVGHTCEAFLRNRRSADPFLLVASIIQPHDVCDWLRLNLRHKPVPPIPVPRRRLPPLPANFDLLPPEPAYVRKYRDTGCEPNIGGWSETEWRWYLWNYYRMVEMADAEIGRILAALEHSGLAEHTLVVFTSDHGEGVGEHRLDRKNFHYEAALRVPLVFSWPGRIRTDVTDGRTLASGIDLVPTLCDFAGVKAPPLTTACSLRPALEDGTPLAREKLVVEMSVRALGRVVRTARFKYAVFLDDPVEQLFDLQADPGETRNLAGDAAFASELVRHRRLLVEWERDLDPVADSPDAGRFRQLPI